MYRIVIALAVALSLSAPNVSAEVPDTAPSVRPSDLKLSRDGLLDTGKGLDLKDLLSSDRLTFHNTIGVNFRSGDFGGMNQYYLNTITYKASRPLVIQAQVGIENTMFGKQGQALGAQNGARLVVPYLGLQYRPSDNLTIDIAIRHMPRHYGYYGGYRY